MSNGHKTLSFLAALLFVLFAGHPVAFAQDAEALLERLQQTYNRSNAVQADITQTTESPFSDRTTTISGTIVMQGERYRVETDEQTVVTDGETVWIYNPADDQVLINDYIRDETAFSPSDFFMNYRDRFNVVTVQAQQHQGEQHHVLRLEPKESGAFFQEVTVWMRDRDNAITRLEVLDADETTIQFELNNITFNPQINDQQFTFSPPSGAEVIDLRA